MRKLLAIFSIFCIFNSCNIPTLGNLFDDCNEVSLFPSKSYDELNKSKDFFEYNGNKYKYVNFYQAKYSTSRNLFIGDAICCKCKEKSFILLKNYPDEHLSINNNLLPDNNESLYLRSILNYTVSKIENYVPIKLFIVYGKNKFVYEFKLDEKNFNFKNFKYDKYGYTNIKDIESRTFLVLKNSKNQEIILKGSNI
ncbi:MAG: hypothetical protein U0457_15865 [Candidatus Sericytochromatia bacterium]